MSSKLVRKLKREFVANPKKGAILGLVLVVAVWFWAPLFKQWFSGPEVAAAPEPAAATTTAPVSGTDNIKTATPAKAARLSWQEVSARFESDPLMRPAEPGQSRDPFHFVVVEKQAEKVELPPPAERPVVSPEQAGLVLTSTMVGAKRKAARLLNKWYYVGDRVSAGESDGSPLEYIITEIHPRRIVLSRDGHMFELELPGAKHDDTTLHFIDDSPASKSMTAIEASPADAVPAEF